MGRTRRRVTVLVLSLEGLGLLLVASGLWMLGDRRLRCERTEPAAAVACLAEVRRAAWLVTPSRRLLSPVHAVEAASPSLGSDEHWLRVDAGGESVRVLAGSARRTASEIETLRALLTTPERLGPVEVRRADWPAGLVLIGFGSAWVLVMSLIMREFLGFHTPWWWRMVGRR